MRNICLKFSGVKPTMTMTMLDVIPKPTKQTNHFLPKPILWQDDVIIHFRVLILTEMIWYRLQPKEKVWTIRKMMNQILVKWWEP